MTSTYKFQKPLLKWVGGKTQIINEVISKLPKKMENYHEFFLGGGSVLLAVLTLQKNSLITINQQIYAYDINLALINVYKHIQTDKNELLDIITSYMTTYDNIQGNEINRKPNSLDEAITSKESYYYYLRHKFNTMDKNTIECSALFMIINKLCFRGMYREGPNGYNVPYGHYKTTPTIVTKTDLDTISELIQNVKFIHNDFRHSFRNVVEGDFIYLDPPYAPENSKSFVGYNVDGFGLETHKELFEEIKKMDGIKFVMSNAKVDLVMDNFKHCYCEEVIARRAINSKNPESVTTEVIIYN